MVTHVDFPKSTIVIVFLALQGTVYLLTTGGEQFKKVHYFAVSSPAPRARITTGDGSDMVGGLVHHFQMSICSCLFSDCGGGFIFSKCISICSWFINLGVVVVFFSVLLFYCLLVFLIIDM